MGRLGAAKRRMLSLAERPSVEVAAWLGVLPLTGAAEGIVAAIEGIELQANVSRVCMRRLSVRLAIARLVVL